VRPDSLSPPRARLAFRVGVVGHRPDRLASANRTELEGLIGSVLTEVRDAVAHFHSTSADARFYSDEPPIIRAVSPLAEGTDRLFAEQALRLGYELCCPMPFPQSQYEADFAPPGAQEPDSLDRFRSLVERAQQGAGLSVFQLDGDRSRSGDAYGAAGRIVLNQSDLLIVVWDGGTAAGTGGTVQTLEEAIGFHVPVLWIDAVAPHSWRLMRGPEDLSCLATNARCTPAALPAAEAVTLRDVIGEIVTGELALPVDQDDPAATLATRAHAAAYFAERKPAVNSAFVWKVFRDGVGSGRFRFPSFAVPEFEQQVRRDWPTSPANVAPTSTVEPPAASQSGTIVAWWVNARLRPHYAWADRLADLCADAYRSTYVLAYLLSATAVFLALLPMASGWTSTATHSPTATIAGELALIGLILLLLRLDRRRRWHERWMEYRLLAEFFRQLRFLVPLGGGRPFPHVPAHLSSYGAPTQTWMFWQVRATARATGLPEAHVTPSYAKACIHYLAEVVGDARRRTGQLGFHLTNSARSSNLDTRLRRAAHLLFLVTGACVAVHLLAHVELGAVRLPAIDLSGQVDAWLTLACAALPALGSALVGINNQGEFARIAKRSTAMAKSFSRFSERIGRVYAAGGATPPTIGEVTKVAGEVAQLMVDEVADWRVVFTDRSKASL
jgi:hypothetical protein